MKKILQNIINKITPCFNVNNLDSLDQINRGINNKSYLRTSINLDILPSLNSSILVQPSPIDSTTNALKSDFFLNSRFSQNDSYKNILDNFINYHGKDSLKTKELILEEQDIADRIYNIHTITGNNLNPNLLRTLKSKEYLTDKDISSIIPDCGHSISDSRYASSITVELSPGGDTLDITSLPDIISYGASFYIG